MDLIPFPHADDIHSFASDDIWNWLDKRKYFFKKNRAISSYSLWYQHRIQRKIPIFPDVLILFRQFLKQTITKNVTSNKTVKVTVR